MEKIIFATTFSFLFTFFGTKYLRKYLEDKKIFWSDLIRGDVVFESKNLSDPILIREDKSLLYHLPSSIIFFAFLYIAIPTFYDYDKADIQKQICKINNVKCIIKGKVTYNFFNYIQYYIIAY